MGNNKKSSRSSRGRSNYVKTMQRSQPKQRRIRKNGEEAASPKRAEDQMSIMLKGLITGGIAGFIVGSVFSRIIVCTLAGCIIGALIGCVADLVMSKGLFKKKEK